MTELRKITRLQFRKFLATEFGIEGMLYLRERTPGVNAIGAAPHDIIFQAGKIEGYKMALDAITETLAIEEVKEQNPENP